jgi:hypothetical protein
MWTDFPTYNSLAVKNSSAYVWPGWFNANFFGSFWRLKVTGKGSLPEFGIATYRT